MPQGQLAAERSTLTAIIKVRATYLCAWQYSLLAHLFTSTCCLTYSSSPYRSMRGCAHCLLTCSLLARYLGHRALVLRVAII